jgi:pimeloyl-ACP methyl ester carboxylesterase
VPRRKRVVFAGMFVPGKSSRVIYFMLRAFGSKTIHVHCPGLGRDHLIETIKGAIVEQVLPKLEKGEEVDVVGHSMGGFIALVFAASTCLDVLDFPDELQDMVRSVQAKKIRVRHGSSIATPWMGTLAARPSWKPPEHFWETLPCQTFI